MAQKASMSSFNMVISTEPQRAHANGLDPSPIENCSSSTTMSRIWPPTVWTFTPRLRTTKNSSLDLQFSHRTFRPLVVGARLVRVLVVRLLGFDLVPVEGGHAPIPFLARPLLVDDDVLAHFQRVARQGDVPANDTVAAAQLRSLSLAAHLLNSSCPDSPRSLFRLTQALRSSMIRLIRSCSWGGPMMLRRSFSTTMMTSLDASW